MAKARGLRTIGLTGKGGGELASRVDLVIRVPSDETPRIQESHIAICHAICEVVDDALRRERQGQERPKGTVPSRTST